MIQTISKIDKKFISENEKLLVNPKVIKKLIIGVVLCLIATAVFVFIKNIFLAIVFLGATITILTALLRIRKNTVKSAYKAIEEKDYDYIIRFDEIIHIKNVTTGQESNINAFEIDYVVEREEYFVLFTRKWQYIPVYKEKLQDVEGFISYLKEQAPCMRLELRS